MLGDWPRLPQSRSQQSVSVSVLSLHSPSVGAPWLSSAGFSRGALETGLSGVQQRLLELSIPPF